MRQQFLEGQPALRRMPPAQQLDPPAHPPAADARIARRRAATAGAIGEQRGGQPVLDVDPAPRV
jgi:hypothetical protein